MPVRAQRAKRPAARPQRPAGELAFAEGACGPVPGATGPLGSRPGTRFVVQRHNASRLHWDLRLEMEGVARSWAIPKEPPAAPGIKRLAIMVEDHPLSYMDFEGVIPKGEYGAGTVERWDSGSYRVEETGKNRLVVHLAGRRLRGRYVLVNTAGTQWLFFKSRD